MVHVKLNSINALYGFIMRFLIESCVHVPMTVNTAVILLILLILLILQ